MMKWGDDILSVAQKLILFLTGQRGVHCYKYILSYILCQVQFLIQVNSTKNAQGLNNIKLVVCLCRICTHENTVEDSKKLYANHA
jgi:hypothetical protein